MDGSQTYTNKHTSSLSLSLALAILSPRAFSAWHIAHLSHCLPPLSHLDAETPAGAPSLFDSTCSNICTSLSWLYSVSQSFSSVCCLMSLKDLPLPHLLSFVSSGKEPTKIKNFHKTSVRIKYLNQNITANSDNLECMHQDFLQSHAISTSCETFLCMRHHPVIWSSD